ncbi:MAG: septal ring lytic transglycosylase RlpA family protein [Hyphomicrobiaceae bacterium]|nr:septal ring lytic transglycosylase RlpA family protein [Hyphomicrobiaceae bacterium]
MSLLPHWRICALCAIAALVAVGSGCSTEGRYGKASPRVVALGEPVPKGGGRYKLGNPYTIDGQTFVPREQPDYDEVGQGSFYSEDFHGRRTANGEVFDMMALSAAHPTLPLPSYAYVTNLDNGRTILVRINDRGPYVKSRLIDLSKASARLLGYEGRGLARVRVRYAGRAPLSGDDSHERRFLASQPWYRPGFGPMMSLGSR